MAITQLQLVESFLEGCKEGVSGTATNPGNLKIRNNQLIHYETPILERYNGKYILNITPYSIQTVQLQKKIKTVIDSKSRIEVKRVPRGIRGSLSEYIS